MNQTVMIEVVTLCMKADVDVETFAKANRALEIDHVAR